MIWDHTASINDCAAPPTLRDENICTRGLRLLEGLGTLALNNFEPHGHKDLAIIVTVHIWPEQKEKKIVEI